MSRPLRIQYPDAWYHVMNRGRRGEKIFSLKEDYESFINLLEELDEVYNVKVAAYCLMTSHYHLLIKTPDANLSRAMRHLNGVYTQRYNKRHNFDGQLFRGRYKSIVVESDSYALELVRYIHQNPLKAALVDNLQKYNWSTHKAYLSNAIKWNWVYKDFILKLFSKSKQESIKLYKRFVTSEVPEEINKIFAGNKLPTVVGSENFITRIKNIFFNPEEFEDIPETKSLAPDIDKVVYHICNEYNIEESVLHASRRGYFNEPRNVCIYLARYLRNDTLKETGEYFGIKKHSTVSSVVDRVHQMMESNKTFKKHIKNLADKIRKSQGRT